MELIREYSDQVHLVRINGEEVIMKRYKKGDTWDLTLNMYKNEVHAYELVSVLGNSFASLISHEIIADKNRYMLIKYFGEIDGYKYLKQGGDFIKLFYQVTLAVEALEGINMNHGD